MFWRVDMANYWTSRTIGDRITVGRMGQDSKFMNRYLYNPITNNLIQNTSSNRKSVVMQIQRFREKQLYNEKLLFKSDKINKRLAKKGRSDLKLDRNGTVGRSSDGIDWSSMVEATKNGKGNLSKNDALIIENEIENYTGIDWRKDPIGNIRWFAGSNTSRSNVEQEVALIACSKSKAFEKLPKIISERASGGAGDRYDYGLEAMFAYNSQLFQKSLTWAENRELPIEIMSAKYGLVDKTTPIDNYDLSLNDVSKKDRTEWAKKIAYKLKKNKVKTVNLLGGKNYVQPLRSILEKEGIDVVEPLSGLGIGERLSYLTVDENAFKGLDAEKNTTKSRKTIANNLEEYAKTKNAGYNSKRLKIRRGVFKENNERDPRYGKIDDSLSKSYIIEGFGE